MDKEVEKFTQQYLASCKEHIERLANNPELLQKTLEPFMKMQEQYLSGDSHLQKSDENEGYYGNDEGYISNIDELKNEVKKLNKEANRFGYKIALMKPKSSEGNSENTSNNNDKTFINHLWFYLLVSLFRDCKNPSP